MNGLGQTAGGGTLDGGQAAFLGCLCVSVALHVIVLTLWPTLRQAAPVGQPTRLLAVLPPPVVVPERVPVPERPPSQAQKAREAGPGSQLIRAPEVATPSPAAPVLTPPAVDIPIVASVPVPVQPSRERLPVVATEARVPEVPTSPASPPPRVAGGSVGGLELDPGSLEQYRLSLISAARRYRRYPPQAMERGWQGRVEVRLEISADGQVRNATVRTSSGYPILDQQALDMITRGKTLTSIPANLRGREFTVDVPVIFDLRAG